MNLVLALLLAVPCLGQRVLFQPMTLEASNSVLGGGKDIAIWTVTVELPPGSTTTRYAILMEAPSLRAIPNRLAETMITRKAYRDRRSTLGRAGTVAAQAIPLALSALGIVSGKQSFVWASIGIQELPILIGNVVKRAPDPTAISAADLLPDMVPATGVWYVVTSLMPPSDVHPIGPLSLRK